MRVLGCWPQPWTTTKLQHLTPLGKWAAPHPGLCPGATKGFRKYSLRPRFAKERSRPCVAVALKLLLGLTLPPWTLPCLYQRCGFILCGAIGGTSALSLDHVVLPEDGTGINGLLAALVGVEWFRELVQRLMRLMKLHARQLPSTAKEVALLPCGQVSAPHGAVRPQWVLV